MKNWKRNFFALWSGQAISLFGSSLVQFALVWWLTQKTNSATVLAGATLIAILPEVVLGPVVGVLVDRWSRQRVMLVSDIGVALTTLALMGLYAAGVAQVWHVYLAMFVRSVAGAFQYPAMQASTSLMVPKEQLARVAGLNQTLRGGLNIVAPPLGALLLSLLPMQGVLAVDVVTVFFGILPLLFVPIPQPPRAAQATASGSSTSMGAELRAGLRYVVTWPGLLMVLLMATLINFLLTPAAALMPILVTKHFAGGAWHLATLESVFGVGTIVGGILLSVWGGFKRRILTSMLGLMGLGLGFVIIGFAPATVFGMALAGAGFAAVMQGLTNGPLFAVLQSTVAPEMQGRVFTLVGSVAGAMAPLSLAVAGPVADYLGIQVWYVVGGAACILMGAGALFAPAIMNLEDHHTTSAATPAPSAETV